MRAKKMPKRHGPSWQTILLIVAGAAVWLGLGMVLNTDGSGSGEYSSYYGPVLPLTATSGGENLEVQRHVDYDFSTYENYTPNIWGDGEAIVTDTYRLTNPGDKDVTARLVYPYEGRFCDERKYTPTITVEGQEIKGQLLASVDEGQEIFRAREFEEYQQRMTGYDFYAEALQEPPKADIPVKVYHFTDITYHGEDYPYIFLTLEFSIPEGVGVWVNHFDVLHSETMEGPHEIWFQDDLDERDGAYLFTVGGDIEDLTFGGNLGHNVTETSALTNVTYEYETYETTFGELLWELAQKYDYWAVYEDEPDPGLITPELLYREAMKRIGEEAAQPYDGVSWAVSVVEDAFDSVITETRLLYWVFDLTIPAGGSADVEASFHQEANTDFGGPKKRRHGYELATRLGSELNFTYLSAGISNGEAVEILRQNFGFDLKKNITRVELDPEEERYYLEVAVKEK